MKNQKPEWFSLTKYRGASKLTAWQWAHQFKLRFVDLDLIELGVHTAFLPKGEALDVSDLGEICRRFGIVPDYLEDVEEGSFAEGQLSKPLPDRFERPRDPPVRLISWGRAVTYLELMVSMGRFIDEVGLDDEENQHVAACFYEFFTGRYVQSGLSEDVRNSISKHADTPFSSVINHYKNLRPFITSFDVDLALTDDILLASFKQALTAARARLRIKEKKFSPAKSQAWRKNQVLPYLDLFIWNECNGRPLTQAKIAKLLFPQADDPIEKLRGGAMRHVRALRVPGVLESLFAQVG